MHDCHCNDLVTNNNQVLLKAAPLTQRNLQSLPQKAAVGDTRFKACGPQGLWSSSREQYGTISKRETAVGDTATEPSGPDREIQKMSKVLTSFLD